MSKSSKSRFNNVIKTLSYHLDHSFIWTKQVSNKIKGDERIKELEQKKQVLLSSIQEELDKLDQQIDLIEKSYAKEYYKNREILENMLNKMELDMILSENPNIESQIKAFMEIVNNV